MMTTLSHAVCAEELNERFGPVNPRAATKVKPALSEWMAGFIRRSPFMVLATASAGGAIDTSPKGGDPGFVAIVDNRTLLIPDYAGNNLFFGHRNVLENPQVSLLFMIPGETWTVRVTGRALIVDDEESLMLLGACSNGEKPRLGIRVAIEECFQHCPKAFNRADLWNPAKYGSFPKPD